MRKQPETKREKELREKLELKLFANTNLDSDDIFAVSEVVMDLLKAEGIIGEGKKKDS